MDANQFWETQGQFKVRSVLRTLLANQQDIDDLAQETSLRFLTHAKSMDIQNEAGWTAYSLTIARNLAVNLPFHRAARLNDLAGESLDLVDTGTDPRSRAINRESGAVLAEAIAGLSEQERLHLKLIIHDGLSHKEAARILGISEAAERQRYCRLLEKLYKILKDQFSTLRRNHERINAAPQ